MQPVISIKQLCKTYQIGRQFKEVLTDISFEVQPGNIIGYLGPTGSGKSTTFKILSGIISDFAGDVTILGMDIRKSPQEIKRRIGYIPENATLYETLTPIEYIQFIGQLHGMHESLITGKASNLIDTFGLRNVCNQRMNNFSRGMKQKVMIISALIPDPDIIFLDEPLNGLDANSIIIIKDLFRQLAAEGKTIFYSSHTLSIIEKISDRVILINEGKIIADGIFSKISNNLDGISLDSVFSQLTGQPIRSQRTERVIKYIQKIRE
jgi:ABC-2 type transport system ATP-binding protein